MYLTGSILQLKIYQVIKKSIIIRHVTLCILFKSNLVFQFTVHFESTLTLVTCLYLNSIPTALMTHMQNIHLGTTVEC